ncbi:hypothetical protein GGI04_003590 [Coemansia thaxteri]|nr:hypothetical protein GGI04_003590 [Coemansia thaxteri]
MDEEVVISPALPSRPLPQPSVASPPPAPSRPALPPIPPMGLAKAPPVPSAAAPPVPGAISTSASQSTAAAARRPSVSSTKSAGSAALPLPGLPPLPAQEGDGNSGKENDTVDEDANQDEETNDDGESVKARGVARLAKIVEDYEAAQPEELNLMSGDVVTIISRGTDDDPRWKGEYHGKKGYFPSHVVEAIEESADLDEEEAESSGARPKGFKLAAYGVQQGGLGSVFAGGGMPTLRRAAPPPRKTDDDEGGSAAAPVPVLAPVPAIPKLRSVQRPPAAKEEPKEEQVNFLAQLSRVPRKQTSEEEEEEAGEIEDGAMDAEEAEETEPARGAPMLARVPDLSSEEAADAAVPEEADAASDHLHGAKAEAGEGSGEEDGQAGEANAEDQAGGDDDEVESGGSGKASGLDPVKSPALAGVKRLVRRAPRQKPTAEGLKKNSEDSQSQSLHSALKKDRELAAPEAEATPRAAPPALPEKPRGLARHGQFSGPQLPTGGFKATGRIGSAMASRLAALQARASGAAEDDGAADDNDAPSARAAAPALSARSPPPQPDAAPSPVVKRPSFNVRTAAAAAEPGAATAAVPQEWQRQIEGEQSRLRSDVDAAKRAGSQVDQLASRLAASEHESQAHKQTISGLERQIESLAAQVAAMASSLTGIQRSVAGLEASKGVTAKEVSAIVQTELKAATQPLQHQSQELWSETKTLHTKISDLRAYVDELVVEEEN